MDGRSIYGASFNSGICSLGFVATDLDSLEILIYLVSVLVQYTNVPCEPVTFLEFETKMEAR